MVHSWRVQPETLFDLAAEAVLPNPETPQAIFLRVFRELRPRTSAPPLEVRFCRFANANSFIQLKHERIDVRLSDILTGAPAAVLEALAFILLSKLFRRPVPKDQLHRYRRHLARKDVRTAIQHVRQARGRKEIAPPEGETHNLNEIFDSLNQRYFHGLMARPELGWSRRVARRTLGHYDPSHHAIVISRLLDSEAVPRMAVEFVLYHEMLHIRFPTEHRGARRCVHTPAFKAEEKRFDGYTAAKELLRRI